MTGNPLVAGSSSTSAPSVRTASSPWANVPGVTTAPATDRPIGRRVALGLFGLSVLGVLWGSHLERGLARLLAPIMGSSGGGLSALLPTGRFRIYSVAGFFPLRRRPEYRLRVDSTASTLKA